MFNPNTPSVFFTGSADEKASTSVYGISPGGIIIAETDSNELQVRPGKNIYFIRERDANAFRLVRSPRVTFIDGIYFIYRPNSWALPLFLTSDAVYNTPIHINLKPDGYHNGDEQLGHKVVTGFNGTCSVLGKVFSLEQILITICMHWYDLEYGNYSLNTNSPVQISY